MGTLGAMVGAMVAFMFALGLWAFFLWAGFGMLVGWAATQKGRSGAGWFILGLLFGPVALVALIAVPPLTPAQSDFYPTVPTFGASPLAQQRSSTSPWQRDPVGVGGQAGRTVPLDVGSAFGCWRVRESGINTVEPGSEIEIREDGSSVVITGNGKKRRMFRRWDLRFERARDGSGHYLLSTAHSLLLRLEPPGQF